MALRRMVLRDFVLVQTLELDLQPGFTVLSGETGAGKSILIDAMQLALGARAESGLVREGAQRAEIVAEFDAPAPGTALAQWLQTLAFESTEETLILRRTIDLQGRSRAWINGSVATVGQLHELGEALVDIHGQHAWQSLMRPASVRALLDAYAGADATPVQAAWQHWRDAQQALEQAKGNLERLRQDRERLQWQIDEVARLAPQPGEWETLNSQHTRLTHIQDLQRAASLAWQALDGAEAAEEGALQALAQADQALAAHRHIEPQFGGVQEVLAQVADQLNDAARMLRDYAQSQEWDAADLEQLDARVSQWLALARRHRQQPHDLPQLWSQWQRELQALDAGIDIETLGQVEQQARADFMAAAQALSRQRQAAAPRLSVQVTQAMQTLGMAGSRFSAAVHPLDEPQAHGVDDIEFLIAGHEGGSTRPLAKVASGGELSRISLAIAVCTSQLGGAETLVFDEVDTGIGGAVAHSVGALMAQLGRHRQVLAVTHLPQVAACADQHLLVHKRKAANGISSSVRPVEGPVRTEEVARMLGGDSLTDTTLAHAQEMLGRAAMAREAGPAPATSGSAAPRRRTGKRSGNA